jgi:methanogenic corrinoid protein MtbC1
MKSKGETHYNIRQVINLTGASEFLLRTWELRYGAITPKRTDTGRRIYTEKDILRIRALVELTKEENIQKRKISEIANLPLDELTALMGERENLTTTAQHRPVNHLVELVDQYQWDELERQFHQQRKKLSPSEFIHDYLLNLIRETNYQVALGRFTIAQEHILSSLIKESLSILKSDLKTKIRNNSFRYVISSPEGDHHDIGLIIASTLIANAGKKGYYLGPNMPKQELAHTCMRLNATHIVIASTLSKAEGAKDDLLNYLEFLDHHLPKKIDFLIAGRNSAHLNLTLRQRNVYLIRDFHEFESLVTDSATIQKTTTKTGRIKR